MSTHAASSLTVIGPGTAFSDRVLTPDAINFVVTLQRKFGPTRETLLARRRERWKAIQDGGALDFLPETAAIRSSDWQVAFAPKDLDDRRVEITGPVDRKMMINALNSGAKVFMADIEDALSPTWGNVVDGQWNLAEAVRGTLSLETEDKRYARIKPDTTSARRSAGILVSSCPVISRSASARSCSFIEAITCSVTMRNASCRSCGDMFLIWFSTIPRMKLIQPPMCR